MCWTPSGNAEPDLRLQPAPLTGRRCAKALQDGTRGALPAGACSIHKGDVFLHPGRDRPCHRRGRADGGDPGKFQPDLPHVRLRPPRQGRQSPVPLHIDRALDVAGPGRAASTPRQPLRVLRYAPGRASELLCRCRYFVVERLAHQHRTHPPAMAPVAATGTDSFQVLYCAWTAAGWPSPKAATRSPSSAGTACSCRQAPYRCACMGAAQLLNVCC